MFISGILVSLLDRGLSTYAQIPSIISGEQEDSIDSLIQAEKYITKFSDYHLMVVNLGTSLAVQGTSTWTPLQSTIPHTQQKEDWDPKIKGSYLRFLYFKKGWPDQFQLEGGRFFTKFNKNHSIRESRVIISVWLLSFLVVPWQINVILWENPMFTYRRLCVIVNIVNLD